MYARVKNGTINGTWGYAPTDIKEEGVFCLNTDTQRAEFGVYPVTSDEITRDNYHNYESVLSVVDGLPVETFTVTEKLLEEVKQIKQQEMHFAWMEAIQRGSFVSQTVSGFDVDCRRNEIDNDVQNLDGVIGLVQSGAATSPVTWKGVSEYRQLTLEQLQVLRVEMLGYAASVYQRKFTTYAVIDAATTFEAAIAVTF